MVDHERTLMHWRIGQRIFVEEQAGQDRAEYESYLTTFVAEQLGWTHYKMLIRIDNQDKREFYLAEGIKNGWTTRQLERQIYSNLWERLLMSNDRDSVLAVARGEKQPSDAMQQLMEEVKKEIKKREEDMPFKKSNTPPSPPHPPSL